MKQKIEKQDIGVLNDLLDQHDLKEFEEYITDSAPYSTDMKALKELVECGDLREAEKFIRRY